MSHRYARHGLSLVAVLALLSPALQGCVVAAAGAGASAGYALSEDRSMAQQVKDTTIGAAISGSWRQYEPKLYENCSVEVYDGRVLITGRVPNEQWRDIAGKLAWQQKDVQQVYNEIQVGPGEHFTRSAEDGLISAKLKTQLLADGNIKSANYDITTTEGVVYIMGIARSRAELEAVKNHARNLDGVRRVVDFVRVGGGPEPSGAAVSASPPPPPPPPPSAEAVEPPPRVASPQPVQSTPLQ